MAPLQFQGSVSRTLVATNVKRPMDWGPLQLKYCYKSKQVSVKPIDPEHLIVQRSFTVTKQG